MFSEYDDYLKLDFLVDYWYDEGIDIASKIISRFEESAWDELLVNCSLRTSQWKIRCAETLDLTVHPTSVLVLLRLLDSSDKEVVLAAADTLRDKNVEKIPLRVVAELQAFAEKGSPPVKAIIGNILEKLDIK
ncbi:hypothetical protein [Variovorax sp. YR566]|uniref:hypothetical protein n=1 Tax=Variovorax sp. YR566 TaxID=3450237 RepID=UPI003F81DF52